MTPAPGYHGLGIDIDELVRRGIQFAFALLPNSDMPVGSFEFGRWLAPYAERISFPDIVEQRGSWKNIVGRRAANPSPLPPETTKEQYLSAVKSVIDSCASRNGKTVFSREIRGKMADFVSPALVFDALCALFPDTLRYVMNIPGEGVWIGATPEVLLETRRHSDSFSTMALAGTRLRSDDNEPWDEKNIIEHKYVADYIEDTLLKAGVRSLEKSPLGSLAYGQIEHLVQYFKGHSGPLYFPELIDILNPTPALCGYPKEAAIADIEQYEPHSRGFYGGFVAVRTSSGVKAYVNLRCCRITGRDFSVFAGGGITALSDPESEYAETVAKSAPLVRLLTDASYASQLANPAPWQ